jgi:hypothetical protein
MNRSRWNWLNIRLFGLIVVVPFALVIILWAIGHWLGAPTIPN